MEKDLKPKITVLMPVYNGAPYLAEAIESILRQTYEKLELLIINDGSTDRSVEIIKSYKDARIRLVHNQSKLKLIATLNKGLKLSRGEYIARMDSDDISRPERLQKQIGFMEANTDVGVCGTWFELIPSGEVVERPITNEEIKIHLFRNCALGHPTVMMRKKILKAHNIFYNQKYAYGEDYELWTRLIKVTKLHNLPEVLLGYRVHESQICKVYTNEQREVVNALRLEQLNNLNIVPSVHEKNIHLSSVIGSVEARISLSDAGNWVAKLIKSNAQTKIYPEPAFSLMLHSCLREVKKDKCLLALRRRAGAVLRDISSRMKKKVL